MNVQVTGSFTGSKYLRELRTDRWVDGALDWAHGITRLLVEVDPAGPSAEFVHFSYQLAGYPVGK
jgi:hypothetical protein